MQKAVGDVLAADPNIAAFTSQAGQTDAGGAMNTGRLNIELKPRSERELSGRPGDRRAAAEAGGDSRASACSWSNPPPINVGGRQARAVYQFTLQGTDTAELYRWSRGARRQDAGDAAARGRQQRPARQEPAAVADDGPRPDLRARPDAGQVETALYSAYGTRQVSQIYAPNNQYQVIMQVAPEFQRDASALSYLLRALVVGPADSAGGGRRASSAGTGPLAVNHTRQLPSVTLSFNLKNGVALGDAVDAVQQLADATLPAAITTTFQGTAQAFQDSLQGLGLILIMAIVVIYIVLGILYESFTHPLTILSGLPSAGFGALLTLLIFQTDLNLYAFVGVIMLVGLVKKNGIMMVDFAVAGAARARHRSARGDPRGVPGPLPADHDDDDGGAGRHAADRASAGAPAPNRGGRSAWPWSAACWCRSC